VRELAGVAAEHDVPLAIENVWNDFLLSPLEFAEFVDRATEDGPVGAYFDVGNILAYGHPEQWIRILGDRIQKIHVKDYDTDIGTSEGFTYPTQGDVPWDAVADALGGVGYDSWITLEASPYPTGGEQMPRQSLECLEAVFD
jgi:hexulose-6-phosphate isomerase